MMHRQIAVTLGLMASLMLVGCTSTSPVSPQTGAQFTNRGLPAKEYLVGGGLQIFYRAPVDGTAYWVEETTAKVLQTKSLGESEDIRVELGDLDPCDFKQAVGIEVAKARMGLYFIPQERPVEGPFGPDGRPARKYQVGGGLHVTYRVPANGTLVWAEERSGRILETRAVEKGSVAQFERTIEEVGLMTGTPANGACVSLFFIPDAR
jgi:hypothetical protein